MAKRDASADSAVGFLTVVEHEQHGLFGGYLVLNLAGRPLEFHCTAPVKPNRAQQILYGPTLEPYLYGEQIGQALVSKSSLSVMLVCTDRAAALAVRAFVEMPVLLVESGPGPRQDTRAELIRFAFGANALAIAVDRPQDRELAQTRLVQLGEAFDLAEPFERIRAAIDEAQKSTRAAA